MCGTHQGQKSAGLHQPAGHMTASDPRTARQMLIVRGFGQKWSSDVHYCVISLACRPHRAGPVKERP
jgi:hypothetical protein